MEESSLIAELRKNRTQYGEGVAFAYAMGEPPSWLADNGVQFERLMKQIKDLETEQNQPEEDTQDTGHWTDAILAEWRKEQKRLQGD